MKTVITAKSDRLLINNKLIYSESPKKEVHGLLMNARFIQGVFDDKENPERFNRFGKKFNPDEQTDNLIKHLVDWYEYGLRAITVGMQGGGPCFTIDNATINNNPFSEDGTQTDPAYLSRMERIINACDELGMVVIVSYFYGAQAQRISDDDSVIRVVKNMSNWLRDKKFTNVIIEIANEHDVSQFKSHPILYTQKGVAQLIDIAKRESGGMLVGCSGLGGSFHEEIVKASSVIIIHGNGLERQRYYHLIEKCKKCNPNTPIVCNEDSQAISNMAVAINEGTSWGYYNNLTKQEPPTDWSITKGEDVFFATRMAYELGLKEIDIPLEEQFYLQGFEPEITYEDKRWIRLASLFPEKIDYVDFYCAGELYQRAYADPFTINFMSNWKQEAVTGDALSKEWEARVRLVDGTIIVKKA